MVRGLVFAAALVFVTSAAAAPRSLAPTITPNVGEGGVSLGMTHAQYSRAVGTLPLSSINWWDAELDSSGRIVYVQTFSHWSIPGTGFVNQRPNNVAVLKRVYGARLGGPYWSSVGGDVFYELKGTLAGRPVHTLFLLITDDPALHMIGSVIVAACDWPMYPVHCGSHPAAPPGY